MTWIALLMSGIALEVTQHQDNYGNWIKTNLLSKVIPRLSPAPYLAPFDLFAEFLIFQVFIFFFYPWHSHYKALQYFFLDMFFFISNLKSHSTTIFLLQNVSLGFRYAFQICTVPNLGGRVVECRKKKNPRYSSHFYVWAAQHSRLR